MTGGSQRWGVGEVGEEGQKVPTLSYKKTRSGGAMCSMVTTVK